MIQLLLVLTTAFAGPGAPIAPPQFGGGGPDAFGYRYIDSDTVAPEAPVYNWIDIREVGQSISGLGDDNVVGPFALGFEFPYYWYKVNSIYMGSNGYIAFGDPTMDASDFQNMPAAERPNNTVCALMSDLLYGNRPQNPAKAWYWTNAARDTFILECDSVPFWGRTAPNDTGLNSFEFILSRPDSSITIQYRIQRGVPSGSSGSGWVPGHATLGIENITGQVGLSYLYGNIPSRNMVHESLAVKYYPPATSSMQVHDAAAWRAMNENNGGIFVLRNNGTELWAKVKNTGNQPETNIPFACVVRNASNSIVFADTVTIASMEPGQVDSVSFDKIWTPTTNGVFTARFNSNLTGDMFRGNDTVKLEVRVVTYPCEMAFDGGTPGGNIAWAGDQGGMGMLFTPPTYPCTVYAIKAHMQYQNGAVGCTLMLVAADGPGGMPGTTLERSTIQVNVNSPTWFTYTFPDGVEITSGSFFVLVTSNGNNDPVYFTDTIKPFSNNSWEYTGVWAPYRDMSFNDVMMRAQVSGKVETGIEELTPAGSPLSLVARPNPFGRTTTIWFSRKLTEPANLGIYNTAGELVNTLPARGFCATWDGRNASGARVPYGIYFARLEDDQRPVLKVVLTR